MKSVYGLLAFITVCQLGVFGRDTQGWFNDAVLAEAKEEQYGPARNAAMLATCFLLDGVPMLYNGQEIADAAPLLQKFSPFRGGCLGETLFGWPSTCPKKRLRSPFLGAIPSHYRQMDLKFVRNEKKLRRCRWEGGGHRRSCGQYSIFNRPQLSRDCKKIKPSQHCIIVESQVMQKEQGGLGFLPAEEGVASGVGPDSRYVGNSVR